MVVQVRKVSKLKSRSRVSVLLNQNTGVKLAIFVILQVLGPMLSDGRIPQIATLT
jgi:hypothetical protein